jgi:transposase
VHQATISVAVLDSTGKVATESILETKAATILEFFAGLRGTLSVTFEERTWAAWLYDLLKPHVHELVVCNPRKNALLKDGNKSDRIDALKLAELLRGHQLKQVYHGETAAGTVPELSDDCQRSLAGHESPESAVSQLGHSLCRKGCLLWPGLPIRPTSRIALFGRCATSSRKSVTSCRRSSRARLLMRRAGVLLEALSSTVHLCHNPGGAS